MKRFWIALALAATTTVAACGGQTSHATCKDEATAKAYVEQFQSDMMAAATSGKVDTAKLTEMQTEMTKEFESLKTNDWGGLCTKIDALKAKYGI